MDAETLRDHAHDVLRDACPIESVLAHGRGRGGIDHGLWTKLVELGWPALGVPEAHGGLGCGIAELAAIYMEIGRKVAPLPYLASMLAAENIAHAANAEQAAYWLPKIATGALVSMTMPRDDTLALAHGDSGFHLTGTCRNLLEAADADLLLLLARDGDGNLHRILIDRTEHGLSSERVALYDCGHSAAHISFDALSLAAECVYPATVEDQTLAHAAIGCAAEALGGAEALLELTIEYLKTRQQFGKPIGAFQALKHRVADHRTRLEAGRVLLRAAVEGMANNAPHGHADAAAVKALICADYVELARDAIQLHGGIGYTQEHACHLFAKRAWLLDALLGGRSASIDRAFTLAQDMAA